MSNPYLYLITSNFSNYAGETDYVVLRLCENALETISNELAPLATRIQNIGGGPSSSVKVSLGHVTLVSEPSDPDPYKIFLRFEKAVHEGDGKTTLDLILNNIDATKTGLGNFDQTIMPETRDRMVVTFSEAHGDEVACSDALIPTRLQTFYQSSTGRLREDPATEFCCTQIGEWLAIVG